MNLRLVLKTYSNLRQLSDDETALLETLRQLNESEREALVETLSPQSVKKAATTRTIQRCDVCSLTRRAEVHRDALMKGFHEFDEGAAKKSASKKSSRASSLEQQIQTRARRGPTVSGFADDTDMQRCEFVRDDNKVCGLLPDHNVHHLQSAMGYHEFDAGKSTAPTASDSSSANGRAGGGTRNLEDETESVAVAVGGSNE